MGSVRGGALICLLLVAEGLRESRCGPRYSFDAGTKTSELFKTRGERLRAAQDEPIMATPSPPRHETRADFSFRDGRRAGHSATRDEEDESSRDGFETSTFNPDVLNKFLEEYASKIKGSTEKYQRYPFRIVKPSEPLALEVDEQTTVRSSIIDHDDQNTKYEEEPINSTSTEDGVRSSSLLTSLSLSLVFSSFLDSNILSTANDLTISVGRGSKRHDKEEQVLRGEHVRR